MTNKSFRCAIYTRKSTEEGLEKEFNTLEAQREACEAYIKSQLHEGWALVPPHYDDGGYTGGNMERPGLRALLSDIKAGRIDVVVVYKVDRLSRPLHDFAQMVAVFDAHNVSFVSITQQFNTTTSMGRLTLNILLSFAQFEREVIGERVRDKVAASKKKGMWMGGYPPLGYDIEHRKLVANPVEAALVQKIFERYIGLRSAIKLAALLNEEGHTNKRWINRHGVEIGGRPFTNQALYKVLNNPLYIGSIRHKEKVYDGQHEAILPQELWEQAQTLLKTGREERVGRLTKHGAILNQKCFSPAGQLYTSTYTAKNKSTHYRYYLEKTAGHRIKQPALEGLVFDTIRTLAQRPEHWKACWRLEGAGLIAEEAQHRWAALWMGWPELTTHEQREVARKVIERIIIARDTVTIRLSYAGILEMMAGAGTLAPADRAQTFEANIIPRVSIGADHLEIIIAARFETYGRTQMALDSEGKPLQAIKKSNYNPVLVNALVKSYRWNRLLDAGEVTIARLATQEGVGRTYVSRIVNLMFLAPDIISGILTGTQPPTMHLQDLTVNLPVDWKRQKQLLKFPDCPA